MLTYKFCFLIGQPIRDFEACLNTFTYESSAVIVVMGSSVLLELSSLERVS